MSHFILATVAARRGTKRAAASCEAADQHFGRECGLLRKERHDCVSGQAKSVAVQRGTRDEASRLAYLAEGVVAARRRGRHRCRQIAACEVAMLLNSFGLAFAVPLQRASGAGKANSFIDIM